MENRDIPALVKHLRSCMGLTQEKFAQELGVSFSTVNQWENGHRRPHPFLLKKLEELEASLASKRGRGQMKRRTER